MALAALPEMVGAGAETPVPEAVGATAVVLSRRKFHSCALEAAMSPKAMKRVLVNCILKLVVRTVSECDVFVEYGELKLKVGSEVDGLYSGAFDPGVTRGPTVSLRRCGTAAPFARTVCTQHRGRACTLTQWNRHSCVTHRFGRGSG